MSSRAWGGGQGGGGGEGGFAGEGGGGAGHVPLFSCKLALNLR